MASLLLTLALLAAPKASVPVTPPVPAAVSPLVGVAPALTATALRDELRARSQQRQEELAALASRRAELERLAAGVAAAQLALEARRTQGPKDPRPERPSEDHDGSSKGDTRAGAIAPPPTSPEALAKTVKGMKADQSAALLQRLDRTLAVEVLRRMKPSDAGAVLEKMKGETAAELFSAMASGRGAPAPSPVQR